MFFAGTSPLPRLFFSAGKFLGKHAQSRSLDPADVTLPEQVPPLVDGHEPLQRVPPDDGLSAHLQHRQLAPVHQLPHGVAPNARTFGGFLDRR